LDCERNAYKGRIRRGGLIKEMKSQFRWTMAVLLFISCLLPGFQAASDEIYQWKDKDGKVYFSDTPPPPGVDLEKRQFKENSVDRPKTKEDTSGTKSYKRTEKRSYGSIDAIMYMTSWCGYCRKARAYIYSLGVNLIEYNIEKDVSKREEMLRKSGGSTGVPLIDVEGIIIRGYSPEAIKAAVEKRRGP